MVCKIFFCSEFPVIHEIWWRKEDEKRQLRSVLFSSKRNNESKNILFLNASAKDRDARGMSCHSALMGNFPTCCHMS